MAIRRTAGRNSVAGAALTRAGAGSPKPSAVTDFFHVGLQRVPTGIRLRQGFNIALLVHGYSGCGPQPLDERQKAEE